MKLWTVKVAQPLNSNRFLVSSCANESQNQRNCLLSSHVIIQLICNTAKQRYIYSKQTNKSKNKDTVIKFLLSCNIRSLCNTAHSNERYVPITGYRRQNYTKTKYINSLGHHRPSPQNDGYDGRQSPQRLSSIHISRQKEMWVRVNSKNMTKKTRNSLKTAT